MCSIGDSFDRGFDCVQQLYSFLSWSSIKVDGGTKIGEEAVY